MSMLPEVRNSSEIYTETAPSIFWRKIPIAGIAGDQQAALLDKLVLPKEWLKHVWHWSLYAIKYRRAGSDIENGLLTTIAWGIDGTVTYALKVVYL